MSREGSIEPSAPVLFHVKTAEMRGRGERIRTSGPCLPNALPLAPRIDFQPLSLRARCDLMPRATPWQSAQGSIRTFGPCAYPCGQIVGQESLRCQGRDTSDFPQKTTVFRCSVARKKRERMGNLALGYRTFAAQEIAPCRS